MGVLWDERWDESGLKPGFSCGKSEEWLGEVMIETWCAWGGSMGLTLQDVADDFSRLKIKMSERRGNLGQKHRQKSWTFSAILYTHDIT